MDIEDMREAVRLGDKITELDKIIKDVKASKHTGIALHPSILGGSFLSLTVAHEDVKPVISMLSANVRSLRAKLKALQS